MSSGGVAPTRTQLSEHFPQLLTPEESFAFILLFEYLMHMLHLSFKGGPHTCMHALAWHIEPTDFTHSDRFRAKKNCVNIHRKCESLSAFLGFPLRLELCLRRLYGYENPYVQ